MRRACSCSIDKNKAGPTRASKNFARYLGPNDVVVVNNSRVIPARLTGNRDTGGHVEIFLVREIEKKVWEALVRPGSRLKQGRG